MAVGFWLSLSFCSADAVYNALSPLQHKSVSVHPAQKGDAGPCQEGSCL